MKNLLHISCKKATYLISKNEEGKLSWLDRIRLRGHLTICSLCRKFEEQTKLIARLVRQTPEIPLPPEAKERIQQALDQQQ
jgi:predicted anti-sigma-YlaC factor YlaD